jgi:hypothetical protein
MGRIAPNGPWQYTPPKIAVHTPKVEGVSPKLDSEGGRFLGLHKLREQKRFGPEVCLLSLVYT